VLDNNQKLLDNLGLNTNTNTNSNEINNSVQNESSFIKNENGIIESKSIMKKNQSLNQSQFMEKIDKLIRMESRERKMNVTSYSKEKTRKPF
jgi:hypothetical protein